MKNELLTSIENPTLAHFSHFSSLFTNFPSTFVVSSLQIAHFMQNKPNFQKDQMNVNMVLTVNYEKKTLGERGKNKPNSNPIQTQSNPIKANKMPKQTQFKPKQTQFVVSLSNLFQTKSTLCEFFLFLIFPYPKYNLAVKTRCFATIIPNEESVMNALNSNVSSGPKYRRDFLKVAAAGACLATIRSKSGRSSRVDLVK